MSGPFISVNILQTNSSTLEFIGTVNGLATSFASLAKLEQLNNISLLPCHIITIAKVTECSIQNHFELLLKD